MRKQFPFKTVLAVIPYLHSLSSIVVNETLLHVNSYMIASPPLSLQSTLFNGKTKLVLKDTVFPCIMFMYIGNILLFVRQTRKNTYDTSCMFGRLIKNERITCLYIFLIERCFIC